MAADPLISVRAGAADPPSMTLSPGQAIGPLSIGRSGTWRVVAPGVLEEHAFLYFNGSELFLQSANPNSPVTVNRSPLPGDWTQVYAPCEIAFGGARLWFGPAAQPAASHPPPVPSRPPPDRPSAASREPFVPRVLGLDDKDESTRLQSIEEMQAASMRRPHVKDAVSATLKSADAPPSQAIGAPTFGAPPVTFGDRPGEGPTPIDPASLGAGPLFGPPPSAGYGAPFEAAPPAKEQSYLGARWREASGPKKAMFFLMGPLIWAVWVIFTDKPPPPRPAKPATSAATSASASASAGAPSASASSTASSAAEPSGPVMPTPTPATSASGKPSAAPASTQKTREREAADAVTAGAYDKAARLYEELAKAHPEAPAYAEAARIMKARAGKR